MARPRETACLPLTFNTTLFGRIDMIIVHEIASSYASRCTIVSNDSKPPWITTQSAELYRRLTPYRAVTAAQSYLQACRAHFGEDWGHDPILVR